MKIKILICFSVLALSLSSFSDTRTADLLKNNKNLTQDYVEKIHNLALEGVKLSDVYVGDFPSFERQHQKWVQELTDIELSNEDIKSILTENHIKYFYDIDDKTLQTAWKHFSIFSSLLRPSDQNKSRIVNVGFQDFDDEMVGACFGIDCLFYRFWIENLNFNESYLNHGSHWTTPGIKSIHLTIHELAHTMYYEREQFWVDYVALIPFISIYGNHNTRELFAESIAAAVLDPYFPCYAKELSLYIIKNKILSESLLELIGERKKNCSNKEVMSLLEERKKYY